MDPARTTVVATRSATSRPFLGNRSLAPRAAKGTLDSSFIDYKDSNGIAPPPNVAGFLKEPDRPPFLAIGGMPRRLGRVRRSDLSFTASRRATSKAADLEKAPAGVPKPGPPGQPASLQTSRRAHLALAIEASL